MSTKTLADVVESLIGASFLDGQCLFSQQLQFLLLSALYFLGVLYADSRIL